MRVRVCTRRDTDSHEKVRVSQREKDGVREIVRGRDDKLRKTVREREREAGREWK